MNLKKGLDKLERGCPNISYRKVAFQEFSRYHAGLFRGGAGNMARWLRDILIGSTNGRREDVEGGSSGNAGDIISLGCHHLKRLFIRQNKKTGV